MRSPGFPVCGLSSKAVVWATLAATWLAVVAGSTGARAASWLAGKALQAKLAQPENVIWQDAPLRETLTKFCRAQRVAILVDRRVDPGREINARMQAVPLGEILQRIAEQERLGLSFFGPVVYLGPPEFTARLRTLAEMRHDDVRNLPAGAGAKLTQSRPFAWDDFAAPRDLVEKLADEGGIEIVGLDQIPHDLWAAADLPPLPLVDRLTLVVGQFDLTFTISAEQPSTGARRRVTLVPLPDEVAIVRSYPAGESPDGLIDRWRTLLPACEIKRVGSGIFVKGRLEDIEKIESEEEGGRQKAEGGKRNERNPQARRPRISRFTGRAVNKPLAEVLQYLSAQLGLELEIDQAALARAGVSLDQLVSFDVKDATADQLLEAVLRPASCTFRRRGNTIEIRPAE